MRTRFDNITSQVDGITDTFTTDNAFIAGSLSLGYNGQLYPRGVNIVSTTPPNQVKLAFIPALDTHTLLIIYEDATNTEPFLLASALPPKNMF